MGWISNRSHRTGSSLYNQGPKRKGPLKNVVVVVAGDHSDNLFGSNVALLECGHIGRSFGGKRAICEKCRKKKPMDLKNIWGVDVLGEIERWRNKS